MSWARVGAAALSLGSTSVLMVLSRAPHPPAGHTTLIVSLGLMPYLWQIPVLMGAVLLLTGQAFLPIDWRESSTRTGSLTGAKPICRFGRGRETIEISLTALTAVGGWTSFLAYAAIAGLLTWSGF